MGTDIWHSYVAGFFDGEGWVTVARVRTGEYSDYHKIIIGLTQRAKHREVLDRISAEFGGTVLIAKERTRVSEAWAVQAKWQLQKKADQLRFLEAIQPYVIVKTAPVRIGIEFIRTFEKAAFLRDSQGRVIGRSLGEDVITNRERLRVAMHEANELGPARVKPSQLPPIETYQRQRESGFPTIHIK